MNSKPKVNLSNLHSLLEVQNLIICHVLNTGEDLLSISLQDRALYLLCHLNPNNSNPDNSTWWQNRPIHIRTAFSQISLCGTQLLRKPRLQTCKGHKRCLLGLIDHYRYFKKPAKNIDLLPHSKKEGYRIQRIKENISSNFSVNLAAEQQCSSTQNCALASSLVQCSKP